MMEEFLFHPPFRERSFVGFGMCLRSLGRETIGCLGDWTRTLASFGPW